LAELSLKVVDSLGDQFPELRKNHRKVVAVLEFEEENYKRLLDKGTLFMEKIRAEYPDLETSTIDVFDSINYYESLKCLGRELEGLNKNIDGKLAFKLYESHGMDESDIEHLSVITKCSFDTKQFQEYFSEQKLKSKFSTASLQSFDVVKICGSLPETEDSLKYAYSRTETGDYEFPLVTSSIVGLLSSEDLCPRLEAGQRGAIITAETSFYHEAGGQLGDRGWITAGDGGRFVVEDTKRVGGQVLHTGLVTEGAMTHGEAVTLELDTGHRLGCMRHHTSTHVLNSVLNTILPVTAQRSSFVTAEYLKFDFSVFKEDVDEKMIETIETRVNDIIESKTQISRKIVDVSEMEAVDNLISLAGENYPASVSLISGAGLHTEPCCGTHLLNTRDIGAIVITSLRGPAPGVRSVRAVTGEAAIMARQRSQELEDSVTCLEADVRSQSSSGDMKRVLGKIIILENSLSGHDVPYAAGKRLQSILSDMKQSIKTAMRSNTKEAGMEAVRLAIQEQSDSACFCHHLKITGADKFNLTNALKLVSKAKPSLLLVSIGKEMKGKAVVPEDFVKRGLKAKDWMDLVVEEVGGRASAPRGQDQDSNCNLMGGKPLGGGEDKMKHIMSRVTEYARTVIK